MLLGDVGRDGHWLRLLCNSRTRMLLGGCRRERVKYVKNYVSARRSGPKSVQAKSHACGCGVESPSRLVFEAKTLNILPPGRIESICAKKPRHTRSNTSLGSLRKAIQRAPHTNGGGVGSSRRRHASTKQNPPRARELASYSNQRERSRFLFTRLPSSPSFFALLRAAASCRIRKRRNNETEKKKTQNKS
jgi:hypothetical protein